MLDRLAELFRNEAPTPSTMDGQLALAALLVDAAWQDDRFEDSERAAIERVLAAQFELDGAAARELLARAETAQREAVDVFRFTYAIKQSTPFEERVGIIEGLWEVALADGGRDAHEDALIRKVCGLIGVGDRDSGLARQRVESRTAGGAEV